MNERDFLVIYESPEEDGDDRIRLNVAGRRRLGELDVEHRVELALSNTKNRVGTAGFIVTLTGFVLGVCLALTFALTYPASYYIEETRAIDTSGILSLMLALGIVDLALLMSGVLMTNYGRRVQAHGRLASVRIVEKGIRH